MKREWFQGANLFGLIAIMALFGWKCTRDEPTPPPVPVKLIEAPAYTLEEVMMQSRLDASRDKHRSVLFVSINAPRMRLYDTTATHPACQLNGKPAQVMQVGENGFGCYRWTNGQVAMRIDNDQWAMFPGRTFKPE